MEFLERSMQSIAEPYISKILLTMDKDLVSGLINNIIEKKKHNTTASLIWRTFFLANKYLCIINSKILQMLRLLLIINKFCYLKIVIL